MHLSACACYSALRKPNRKKRQGWAQHSRHRVTALMIDSRTVGECLYVTRGRTFNLAIRFCLSARHSLFRCCGEKKGSSTDALLRKSCCYGLIGSWYNVPKHAIESPCHGIGCLHELICTKRHIWPAGMQNMLHNMRTISAKPPLRPT